MCIIGNWSKNWASAVWCHRKSFNNIIYIYIYVWCIYGLSPRLLGDSADSKARPEAINGLGLTVLPLCELSPFFLFPFFPHSPFHRSLTSLLLQIFNIIYTDMYYRCISIYIWVAICWTKWRLDDWTILYLATAKYILNFRPKENESIGELLETIYFFTFLSTFKNPFTIIIRYIDLQSLYK